MKNLKRLMMGITGALAVAAMLYTVPAYAGDFPANPVGKEGYTLDYSDEFNGTELDTTKWTNYYLPHWADDPETAKGNVRLENGNLVQTITEDQKPWSPSHDGTVRSSAIMSFDKSWIHNFSGTTDNKDRDTWYGYKTMYGYFEIRAKLADCGGGGHQAWWMVGMQQDTDDWFNSKQTGEIDILETFYRTPNAWRIAAFGWNDPNFQTGWYLSEEPVPSGDPTKEFHIYAMDWSPECLKFYYDNKLYKVIYDAPDYEMGTILNIYTDAGSGVHNDVWPKEWAIDYFRVWKSDNGYDKPDTNKFLIQNRQTNQYMYLTDDSKTAYGDISQITDESAFWYKEYRDGYVLLKNAKTEEYLHVENQTGYVEHGKVSNIWWSAQWKEVSEGGYTRFTNRWKPEQAIHTEALNGFLEYGVVPSTYWTNQWRCVPVA